jgi:hypothetical protein
MSRQLSEEQARELAYFRARSLLILDFIVEHSSEPFPSAPALREVVEQTAQAQNLRGMRIVRSDLLDMSRALGSDHQRALAQLLAEQARDDPWSEQRPT